MDLIHMVIVIWGILFFLWFLLPFVAKGIINIGNITGMLLAGMLTSYGMHCYSTPSRTCFVYLPTYYVRELYGILYYTYAQIRMKNSN